MSRFTSASEQEIKELVKEKDSKRTAKATEVSWRVFKQYCEAKSVSFNEKTTTKAELDNILKHFYIEVRKQDGKLYKKDF